MMHGALYNFIKTKAILKMMSQMLIKLHHNIVDRKTLNNIHQEYHKKLTKQVFVKFKIIVTITGSAEAVKQFRGGGG